MFSFFKTVIPTGYHKKKKNTSIVKCEELAFARISLLKMPIPCWSLIGAYKVPLFTLLQNVEGFLITNII
jgi:hypothetical protein